MGTEDRPAVRFDEELGQPGGRSADTVKISESGAGSLGAATSTVKEESDSLKKTNRQGGSRAGR